MKRSNISIDGLSLTDTNENTKYNVTVLSPKGLSKCAYCHEWMEKTRWFSITPKGLEATYYCSFKCMWIVSHNSYREFDRYETNGSITVVHRIKHNIPLSLAQTTSAYKTEQIFIESEVSIDSITRSITRIAQLIARVEERNKKASKKTRYSREDWMKACRMLREVVNKNQLVNVNPPCKGLFTIDVIFENE